MTTAELYEDASQLKAQGRSLAEIGRELAVTKQYVHKLLKNGPPVNPEVSPSTSTKAGKPSTERARMTVRQRRFARGLLEGRTQREAALEAPADPDLSPDAADTWARRQMGNDGFQSAFQDLLARNGLGEAELARVHRETLAATKIAATASRDGKITDVLEAPDYAVRQRAVEAGWKLHGRGTGEDTQRPERPTRIVILASMAENLAALCGGQLPRAFIEIAPDESKDMS